MTARTLMTLRSPLPSLPVSGCWSELRNQLEAQAASALGPGHHVRVRAGLPFGREGMTVLFAAETREGTVSGPLDEHRLAAVLRPESTAGARSTEFRASLHSPGNDPELPALGTLMACGTDTRLIAGNGRVAVRLLSYRPLRRAAAELRSHGTHRTGDDGLDWGGTPYFAKLVRPERAKLVQRRLESLSTALTGTLRAAPLITVATDSGITITAAAPGIPLSERLATAEGGSALEQLGRALLELERLLEQVPNLSRDIPDYEFADAVADLGRFVSLGDRLDLDVAGPVAAAQRRMAALSPESGRRAIVHRDLHDKQVFMAESITLLDLDQVSIGDPALDLGNLLAHIRLRSLQGRLGLDCTTGHRALLGGYGPARKGRLAHAVLVWEALTLTRLAVVYALRPTWSHLGPELARAAHDILDYLGAPGGHATEPTMSPPSLDKHMHARVSNPDHTA